MKYVYKEMPSPVGLLTLIATERGLAAILWENDDPGRIKIRDAEKADAHPLLLKAERQLTKYFQGQLKEFSIPLDMRGTEFQQQVWQALLTIPYGKTRSYGEIAKQIRRPKASRAVGAANGKNPVSIIVPCHRVIGASGKLTGFAGGLPIKKQLLELEQR